MAGTNRSAAHFVEICNELEQKPYSFGFYYALRLIECNFSDKPRIGHSMRLADEKIRLSQDPSLAFAPSTIASFDPGKGGFPPRLSVFFLGLLGPNGPLPLHLTEYARDRLRNANDPTFVRFLDLFHHRMLSLFYRSWASAQPVINFDRPQTDRFSIYVGSVFGVGMPSLQKRSVVSDIALMHYAGRFSSQTKNAEGLQAIIAHFFSVTVLIKQFIGKWVELPYSYRFRLGESPQTGTLGVASTLGNRVWDCQQKFRIVIGPMLFISYLKFFPGGESIKLLISLVRLYVGDELDWDVQLLLKKEELPFCTIDGKKRLGFSTWLGEPPRIKDADELILRPFTHELN